MTVNSDAGNNACYNRIHKPPSAGTKPRGIRPLLLLAAVLGAETFITATLLYSFSRELHTATGSLDHDVFPTECLRERGDSAARHGSGLESCDLMLQEIRNSVNARLLLDIRNSLWQSLGDHNITQVFKPAIHVRAKHELHQYHRLQRAGDSQDCCPMMERLHWDVLSGQGIQEGLTVLSPDGEIVVPQDGIYFVYSQVLFRTSNPGYDQQLVQYLLKRTPSQPELTLLAKAGPSRGVDLLSSHQGALFRLEHGDRISLFVSDMAAVLLQPEATYFGAFKID